MKDETYNGWKNYQTWNVWLWMQNEQSMMTALENRIKGGAKIDAYECWHIFDGIFENAYGTAKTPDGVKIGDPKIDWQEIVEMINNDYNLL